MPIVKQLRTALTHAKRVALAGAISGIVGLTASAELVELVTTPLGANSARGAIIRTAAPPWATAPP